VLTLLESALVGDVVEMEKHRRAAHPLTASGVSSCPGTAVCGLLIELRLE
jgi:hypothetical protein